MLIRIKRAVRLKFCFIERTTYEKAQQTLYELFNTLIKRAEFNEKNEFLQLETISSLQKRMRHQIRFKKARSDFLRQYYDFELLNYKFALDCSPKKKHKTLVLKFADIDKQLE
jgi:hypothetical protein